MKPKQHRSRKLYSLALFSRIQGTVIQVCAVESWFATTRHREAQAAATRYNREHYYNAERREYFADKWVAPVVLA